MDKDIFEENKKPTLKDLFLDYKDKRIGPIQRKFNAIYVIVTLLLYLYYLGYGTVFIVKYGLEEPASILLLIAIIIYTLILVICAIISSSIKTAKKRIKKTMKVFNYFKTSVIIISSIVAIIALVATVRSDSISGWTMFVSIFSLIMNMIRITFALITLTFSAGTSVIKYGAKKTMKYIKKNYSNKKSAPAIETDADIIDSNE